MSTLPTPTEIHRRHAPGVAVKPWTETHRREARARLYQIAARMVIDGLSFSAACDVAYDTGGTRSEGAFRVSLKCYARLDPARIDREIRRVRDLAEGRLVRETSERYMVRYPEGSHTIRPTWEAARGLARAWNGTESTNGPRCRAIRVRVTRIRRAQP